MGSKRSKAEDVVFEGVVIPRDTRSARIAAKGIQTEEDMGDFLTSVFAETLSGKIVLPRPQAGAAVPYRAVNGGLKQKLKRGLPVRIQMMEPGGKKGRKSKDKGEKEETAGAA